ncbi:MAG: GGDEF domain-containing protein [Acidobacteria bacterium]|nr:GGDEF domain-containing protein [Acidobacteriota bacterium]
MRDSFASRAVQRFSAVLQKVAAPNQCLRRWALLSIASSAALLICVSHAATASANTIRASGIGYLAFSLVLFGCASAFWTRARSTSGTLYARWSMISAATVAAAIGYLPSFSQAIFNTPPARQFQTAAFNASEALYLLAVVLFFAGVSRSIVVLDTLQAILFVVIRFKLIYSPVTSDHFSLNHLLVGQFVALCLLVVATVGCLGAASRAELIFLRTISWFFGLRLISFFFSNQVSYTWLHYINSSLWDLPGTVFLSAFALYLLYTDSSLTRLKADAPLRSPSVAVQSLMPSFLAVLNLMLALFLLRVSIEFAAGALCVSIICYVVRTVLLQAQAMHEKTALQSRNEQLEGLAIRDPLTGIGNRRSLARAYDSVHSSSEPAAFSLLLMDIDHFKQANDSNGHLHGDEILVKLARELERLSAEIPGSHSARFGGDEFALLLSGVPKNEALGIAEDLRTAFTKITLGMRDTHVSLSIGVASEHAENQMPLEIMISEADKALYRAKIYGRNRVELQPEMVDPSPALASPRLRLQHETN